MYFGEKFMCGSAALVDLDSEVTSVFPDRNFK